MVYILLIFLPSIDNVRLSVTSNEAYLKENHKNIFLCTAKYRHKHILTFYQLINMTLYVLQGE